MSDSKRDLPAEIKILFYGFPGRAARGYLGWSSVVLINGEKKILFDTGNWGDREELVRRLRSEGIGPEDVNIVILSHLHFDHCINVPLFEKAQVILSEKELDYAYREKGDLFIPDTITDYLQSIKDRVTLIGGDTVLDERITLIETPGHTPGSISCLYEGGDLKVLLAGDAVKNSYEFISGCVDMTKNQNVSKATIERIRQIANVIIPGHDRPFWHNEGQILYLSESEFEFMVRASPYSEGWTKFKISFA
ncbi:MAG: hypothetical protein DRH12_16340 [Deltaproteobacteria bacterium]|nr:MAG: hypothetical protein DRH12_16340 [Deltaproteobacteria bacterium]